MLQPGQILEGKFRILRLIGEGGMGAVYEAQHEFLGRRVAIKILNPDFARNEEAVRRFYREAQAAARIGHENICEVTDIGQVGGSPYIVMQLLQGESLAKMIVESAPLPVGRAVDIAQQTLEALAAAHAAGIVHRDMKPDNIFLTKVAGRADFVKLLDFGISKVRTAGTGTKLTQEGTVLGTPQYMSPEQARGQMDVDGRADVWAVGIIFFEMLTGRIPFDGSNYNQIIFNVVAAPIPRLRALREGVTPELEAVVMHALERDVGKRYPTALAFRDELLGAWMGTGESGFAVRSSPSIAPSADEAATELAPAMLLAQVQAGKGPVPRAVDPQRVAVKPQIAPAGSTPASNIVVAEPRDTVGLSSSTSGVPTSPKGMVAAAKLAERGTVEVTPGATVAMPGATTAALAPSKRKVPLVPAAILGAAVVGIAVFLLVRPTGSTDGGTSADAGTAAAAPTSGQDAGLLVASATSPDAGREDGGVGATTLPTATDAGPSIPPQLAAVDVASTGEKDVTADSAVRVQEPPPELVKPATDEGVMPEPEADVAVPVPTPDRATGRLSVVTAPSTQVYIDGDLIGRAPFFNREIAAGPHQIVFVNEAQRVRREERLVIIEGRTSEIRRTAEQLGAVARPPAADAGTVAAPADAGRVADGIRIRTGTYGRDAR
jgi:serine/threonine protein kinase